MPLFQIDDSKVQAVAQTNFTYERDLQSLVENNLKTIFNCRLVASEFSTGAAHSGRIDTLALSEDGNPVIIEYKKVESSALINQSLFYLAWMQDHQGDFEIAAQKELGAEIEIDWSAIRVICIAPGYKKYDLLAASVMGANLELWRYRYYENNVIHFEEVGKDEEKTQIVSAESKKNPVMVEAGRKAAITRTTGIYTFEEHLEKVKDDKIRDLILMVDDFILELDSAIERAPKKKYIAYKTTQNIVCLKAQQKQIKLYLKLSAQQIKNPPKTYSDATNKGHAGTGDSEFTITNEAQLDEIKDFIETAYLSVGG